MFERITAVITGYVRGHPAPPPPVPEQKVVNTPPDSDDAVEPVGVAEAMVPQGLFIEYRNAKGIPSARRISLKAVEIKSTGIVIRAFCFEKNTTRTFRADRITEMQDLGTGEIFEGEEILEALKTRVATEGSGTREDRLLLANNTALNILAYLARCDGDYSMEEEDVIFRFIRAKSDGQRLRVGELRKKIRGLAPDIDDFDRAVMALPEMPPDEAEAIWRTAIDVVQADGVVTPEESQFITELEAELQAG